MVCLIKSSDEIIKNVLANNNIRRGGNIVTSSKGWFRAIYKN